eukprot:PhM_4_TR4884/c1_g1_i3/m.35322/K00002/AKR1A1, adh; alcohol dehydrogenase (NADP+)
MASPLVTLNNGAKMPLLGLGTYNGNGIKAAVLAAIKAGYRHFDCATLYGNEADIGAALEQAMQQGLVKREELWITSKVWNTYHARADVLVSLRQSLRDLRLEYLDLLLVHWPVCCNESFEPIPRSEPQPTLEETWLGMMDTLELKLVRTIGVSNYGIAKLKAISHLPVVPAVNQCELHPYHRQDALLAYCKQHNIHMTAYCPLGSPSNQAAKGVTISMLTDPNIKLVADKYPGATVAQVLLAWGMQRGTSVIPKSVTPERIQSNMDAVKLTVREDDMAVLNNLPTQYRFTIADFFCAEDAVFRTPEELWQ